MANVRVGLDTADYESGSKKLDVRDFIFQLEPSEAPFTTLLSKVRKESTRDVAFSWFEDLSIGKWTQINYGAGYSDSATSLVVDDADIFQVGDLVKSVTSGEIMKVATVTVGTNTITVTRAFGSTAAAAIADDAYLFRLGQIVCPSKDPEPFLGFGQAVA